MLRLNVLNSRPCILKTPDIHRVDKCVVCGRDLSEFTEIQLHDNKEIENLKGKICIDCDLVYVSNKAPDCVFDITKDKFKEFVHIETINPNPSKKKKVSRGYNNESKRIQRFSTRESKTMVPSRRSKSRSY